MSDVLYHFNQLFTGCDMWCLWTLPDGVHKPNFGCDRHENHSFVSKMDQNGPKFHKNQHRQVCMAVCDLWWNTWSAQFKVICPWLNTWSKWYSIWTQDPLASKGTSAPAFCLYRWPDSSFADAVLQKIWRLIVRFLIRSYRHHQRILELACQARTYTLNNFKL